MRLQVGWLIMAYHVTLTSFNCYWLRRRCNALRYI